MLLVHAQTESPRWKYIAHTLLADIAGLPFMITGDADAFRCYEGPVLHYGSERIRPDEFLIVPEGLLDEPGLRDGNMEVITHQGHAALFGVQGGDLPFDLFSASFWLLSRYEEYLPHQLDAYGRYAHTNSLAFRAGFLQTPLVSIWADELRASLKKKFPALEMKPRQFRFLPTYDIDIAFSYLHKSMYRTLGGLARNVLKGEWDLVKERWAVMRKKRKDPYDVYEWLDAQHLAYGLKPYYFFLVADEQVGYDRNIHPSERAYRELISYHAMGYPLGIHPSWQSGDKPDLLEHEISTLETISGKSVTASRQHYIRFRMPDTFRRLIGAGIDKDFSMGYGTINGFRASVAAPFFWYDLEREQQTTLRLYPFCYMDANSIWEQQDGPARAFDELSRYHDLIKRYKGTMITIWHNNVLGDTLKYKGWKDVYETFLRDVVYWDI